MHLVGYILTDTTHFAIGNLVVGPLVGDQSWEKMVKVVLFSRTFILMTETNAFGSVLEVFWSPYRV